MNYYVVIPFIALLYNVATTAYVWSQRRTSINRAYIILSLTTMGWILLDVIHWSPIDPGWIMPALKIQSIFYLSIGFVFTNFSYEFLHKQRDWIFYTFLAAVIIAVPLSLSTDLFIRGYTPLYWGPAIIGGPVYVPLILLLILPQYSYSLLLLFRRMRTTQDLVEKRQIILFLAGNILAAVASFVSVVAFPEFLGMHPLPMHDVGIMLHLGFISWAIVRYRFLSLNVEDIASDLFSNVQDGVLIINRQSDFIQANNAALKILNVQHASELNDKTGEILREFDRDTRPGEYEVEFGEGNNLRIVRISKSPVVQSDKVVGTIVFLRDVTQQVLAEREIRRVNEHLARARDEALSASRAKSDFLANMSHELRTPLNAIIGYADLLQEEAVDKGESGDDLERIRKSGEHLLSLINDILDLSKIEAGKMELHCESFTPIDLIDDVLLTVQPLVDKNNNRLEVSVGTALGEMHTDRIKLRQVLINLLSNACKFTDNGIISLTAARIETAGNEQLQFAIRDNGIGISPEQQASLFEQFRQVDSSTTRKYEGSGLGLALSRQFCRMMGGDIEVSSETGKGSTFTVMLPTDWVGDD